MRLVLNRWADDDFADLDVDHRRPAVDVTVGQRTERADAGIAHQHVEPPEPVDRILHQLIQVRSAGHVDPGRHHFGTVAA